METVAAKGTLNAAIIEQFRQIAGSNFVLLDEESLNNYGHDETEHLLFPPEVVIRPRTTAEISAIMKICNQHKIPVTPRGAGTGLSGGALPHLGGVLISTDRMNSILSIDEIIHGLTQLLRNASKARLAKNHLFPVYTLIHPLP